MSCSSNEQEKTEWEEINHFSSEQGLRGAEQKYHMPDMRRDISIA